MFYRIKRAVAYWRFSRIAKGILDTPPIALRPAPIRVVSMLQARDMLMYLLAIKSFYARIPGGSIEVLDDGSLTGDDRNLLARHIPGIEITAIAGIATGSCPRGGCWERLLHILDRSAKTYVIQLDADVLTTGPVPEVIAAIEANASFTLGSAQRFGIVDLETAAAVHGAGDQTFQTVAEQALPRLPPGAGRCYVRGSAGFAGFARGAATREDLEAFSRSMEENLGARWQEWGSEQVASNYIVANAEGGHVLPWSRYACFYGEGDDAGASLLHFIGTWRFSRGVFIRGARRVTEELSLGPPGAGAA